MSGKRRPAVPKHFYKYRSMRTGEDIARVESVVMNNAIFFAPVQSFNDPFDLNPVFSLEASPEERRRDYGRLSRKFQPSLSDHEQRAEVDQVMTTSLATENVSGAEQGIQALARQAIVSNVGVFCVSERRDDLLMWAHYADSHRGICLEFDGFCALMAHAQRVSYSTARKAINVYRDDHDTMAKKALLTKSAHWTYEAEWRLLRLDQGPGAVQFRPSNLTGIVIGAMANHDTISVARQWRDRRPTPLALYRARISLREFSLSIGRMD